MHRILATLLVVCCLQMAGQQTEVPKGQRLTLTQQHFDALDGLSSNNVYHITRDPRGFMWLATANGLDRFDGRRFEHHPYADMVNTGQRMNQVLIQAYDREDGTIHINLAPNQEGTSQDTLIAFSTLDGETSPTAPEQEDGIRNRWPQLDEAEYRWDYIGSLRDSMALFRDGSQVSPSFEFLPAKPWSLWPGDREQGPWLQRSNNRITDLLFLRSDSLRHIQTDSFNYTAPRQGDPHPMVLRCDSTGLWYFNIVHAEARGALIHLDLSGQVSTAGHWSDWFPFPVPVNRDQTRIARNPWNGDLWCFHENLLAIVDQKGQLLHSGSVSDNLQFTQLIHTVHFTESREAWVGTWKGFEVFQAMSDPFEEIFSSGSENRSNAKIQGLNGCREIVELGPDSIVFVTNGSGVRLWNRGASTFLVDEYARGAGLHWTGDTLFIMARQGLGWLDDSGKHQFLVETELTSAIWTTLRAENHRWLIGANGVFTLEQGQIHPYGTWPDDRSGNVYQLEERRDTLWAIGSSGIHAFDAESDAWLPWSAISPTAPAIPEAHHRMVDSRGLHWISTASSGLIRWNPTTSETTQFNMEMGLPSTTVYGGVEDRKGWLWFSTDNGLFSLDPLSLVIRVFDRSHGLHETEFNRTGVHRSASGKVYFSTINGLIRFDPQALEANSRKRPPLVVTSLLQHRSESGDVEEVLDRFNRDGSLTLEAGDDFVALKLALLDFSAAPQYFRYRTRFGETGKPSEWINIDEPEINLSGLPSGTTRLEVQARQRGTGWPERGLLLPIRVAAPWYTRVQNILALFLAVGALIGLAIRWRFSLLRNRNAQLEAMVAERTQNLSVALDLQQTYLKEVHHRVKNNLQIIGSLLDLQSSREPDGHVKRALGAGRSRIDSISLVHQHLYLNPDAREIQLTDFISEYVQRVEDALLEEPEAVQWDLEGDDIRLDIEVAQPFGLLINELLTNSLRHAIPDDKPLAISIRWTEAESGVLRLEYADNGPGLPPDTPLDGGDSLGLRLIQRLSQQLKGIVALDASNRSRWTIDLHCSFENKNE